MDEANLQILIAVFKGEKGIGQAVEILKTSWKEEGHGGVQSAVGIVKDQDSAIHYKDIGMTPVKGALGGVVIGAVIGVLTGGVGIVLGALGALVGGLLGERKRAGQFSDVRMNEVVASLVPGSSAVVTVVTQERAPELEGKLETVGAEIFSAELSSDLAEQLESHRSKATTEWIEKLGK